MTLTDSLLFLILCVLCQAGILRLWMDSYIFHLPQRFFAWLRDYHKGLLHIIGYLLTCWQCFGTWCGWFVVWLLAMFLPSAPFACDNYPCIFLFGIATGFVSELVEYYVISHLNY